MKYLKLLLGTQPAPSVSIIANYYVVHYRWCLHYKYYADIADLAKVKRFLKNIHDWQSLGLELGLLYPTLKRIKKEQQGDINDCMMEMLAAWLQQQDSVSQHGVPSWSVLQTALVNLGENQLANEIST